MGFGKKSKKSKSKKGKEVQSLIDCNPPTEDIMRLVLHSVNNVTRETDTVGKIDPYIIVTANNILLGKTKVADNATTAAFNETFMFKPKGNASDIKLKFALKDYDSIGDDDDVGNGYFNLGDEAAAKDTKVLLKWKGDDIGHVIISIHVQPVIIVK